MDIPISGNLFFSDLEGSGKIRPDQNKDLIIFPKAREIQFLNQHRHTNLSLSKQLPDSMVCTIYHISHT